MHYDRSSFKRGRHRAAPRERVESLNFFAEGLLEDLHNLQNIQLSLNSNRLSEAANRTNEVMRILTLFSLFFLPMNFIVGVYGMNLTPMPELHWRYGYLLAWGLIALTVGTIYFWFRRRGWLHAEAPAVERRPKG